MPLPSRAIKKKQNIGLYLLAEAKDCSGSNFKIQGQTGMSMTSGPDHSESLWPVVVKYKSHVTADTLVAHLRDLADAIQSGYQQEIKEPPKTRQTIPGIDDLEILLLP
ncbi:MAG: hypothetical protein COB67_08680 [SAR324 cluster bacterium]|uniref:Uncharacterized protein n=1 Tax=SAR324 cluster bacterium TaxID=2024889 RepID=A0A2A4T192_9DELT|nr:MAG: hypothetical protein COB67_08680 [SAR324 cluster bacterium]